MLELWARFFLAAGVIILAASSLSRNADIVAEKTGLGRAWVGVLLLPLFTSLPEIVTSAQAALVNNPDLALGNVLGSNMFNLMIIAVIDLVQGSGPILRYVRPGHILTASIGVMLAGFTAFAVLAGGFGTIPFLKVGYGSLVIVLLFLAGLRLIVRYERRHRDPEQLQRLYAGKSLPLALTLMLVAGVLIVFSGRGLALAADEISRVTALGGTFVGTFMMAIATSLPELVATIAAVRLGALDMAVGNILGANVMNMIIIVAADGFYRQGSILAGASSTVAVAAVLAMMLTAIVIIGLIYKSNKSYLFLGLDAYSIIILYLAGAFFLYRLGLSL